MLGFMMGKILAIIYKRCNIRQGLYFALDVFESRHTFYCPVIIEVRVARTCGRVAEETVVPLIIELSHERRGLHSFHAATRQLLRRRLEVMVEPLR
jgi:hypothetical protein